MTDLNRPSPEILFNRMRDLFSSNVLGGAPIIPESNEFYVVSNDYAVAEEFYSIAEQQWREKDARYACCDNLISMAANDGVYPIAASFSQGYALITGTIGVALPAAIAINYNGDEYSVISDIPPIMPTTGELVIRVEAVVPGPNGNLLATGQIATLTNPITNVNDEVAIYGNGFCGGADAESCEQFRLRYIDRKKYKPLARLDWIMQKVAEWPCVTRVCRRSGSCCGQGDDGCGCAVCGDKLELYPIMDDTFENGLPPQCVVDEITTWMFGEEQGIGTGQLEYGVCGALFAAQSAEIDILIEGFDCAPSAQIDEIRVQIEDLFLKQCPSEPFCTKNIDVIVATITGAPCDYEIDVTTTSPNIQISDCGDVEPDCDYLITLGSVTFEGQPLDYLGGCS